MSGPLSFPDTSAPTALRTGKGRGCCGKLRLPQQPLPFPVRAVQVWRAEQQPLPFPVRAVQVWRALPTQGGKRSGSLFPSRSGQRGAGEHCPLRAASEAAAFSLPGQGNTGLASRAAASSLPGQGGKRSSSLFPSRSGQRRGRGDLPSLAPPVLHSQKGAGGARVIR